MNNSFLRGFAFVTSMVAFCWQEIAAGAPPANAEIVVSPEGNDAAGGTAQEPVATLHRAQELARTALAQGQSVRVTLSGWRIPIG